MNDRMWEDAILKIYVDNNHIVYDSKFENFLIVSDVDVDLLHSCIEDNIETGDDLGYDSDSYEFINWDEVRRSYEKEFRSTLSK